MLEIQKLMRDNPNNWEDVLKTEPYSLTISYIGDYDDRVMFKYKQGISDYSQPIVREARGLILNKNTYEVICMGFTKFFLCDSQFSDTVDWNNIQVQEKFDGTLITLYYYKDKWIPATTGTIDANFAPISQGNYTNFAQLFNKAVDNCSLDYSNLDTNCCYMFELCSPYNKQVVQYDDIKIVHIGTRNRITLEELNVNIGVEKPNLYPINNIDDAITAVNAVNYDGEGFVAVDKDFHRIKIKSDEWFKWHYMLHNGSINVARAVEILLTDDCDEFLTRYPHYKEYFNDVKLAYTCVKTFASAVLIYVKIVLNKRDNRKDMASDWNDFVKFESDGDKKAEWFVKKFKSAYFGRIDNDNYTVNDFLENKFTNQIVEMVEYIYEELLKHKNFSNF